MKKSLVLIFLIVALFFSGCGYKPASTYAKKEIGKNVFVDLFVNLKDPKNAVLIKDAMNEILVHRLGANLVNDKSKADTVMNLKLNSVSMNERQYDEDGFIKLYKAVVNIKVDYQNAIRKRSFNVSGDYDFSIDDGTTITDTKRFEAIKNASSKALEEIISKIAIQSFKK